MPPTALPLPDAPTVLLERRFPRTLDAVLERFGDGAHGGARIEAWLFEDAPARQEAERRLGELGITARLRSAYKPLLHAFLEGEIAARPGESVLVRLPSLVPARFRLEAYPLAALLPEGCTLRFEEGEAPDRYEVILEGPDGARARHEVFAPNHPRTDHLGEEVLAPCGWLRAWPAEAGATPDLGASPIAGGTATHPAPADAGDGTGAAPSEDGPLHTEFEAAFAAAMGALAARDWGPGPRLFEVLEIRVETGGIERPLPVGSEVLSTREALHEDLYFSALELFQRRAGLPLGDRRLQPGQILPEVLPGDGDTRLRVSLRGPLPERPSAPQDEPLDTIGTPLEPDRLAAETARLGGERFDATSVQGRAVPAIHHPGDGPALVISAAQHANEASGVVGALRAAAVLRDAGRHFALIPLENPDGYALHRHLRATHAHHMHHAARYTALGDDLEAREAAPWFEKTARIEAFRRTGARLHVNLHGYPAHEWTRPLSGYVPRGFASWTVPRGFFLILRHHPGLEDAALALVQGVAERLGSVPGLLEFNRRCLALHRLHAGDGAAGPVHADIPYVLGETTRHTPPFTLITEYPDETVGGDAFRLAQEAQRAAVLAAAELSAIWAPAGS
ncbi:peptidase M14 [Roseomonas elaeocarpi]|uniref:Peptidase M14 n=1 Tax=Roseomonas elaeocarpi TaxID=907779 RepID=A0ABV6JUF1_9PROT